MISPISIFIPKLQVLAKTKSFSNPISIFINVSSRHHEELQNSTTNVLLINLCFSNLLVSFLVKPISAIYAGYSISTGNWQVLPRDITAY